MKRRRKGWAVLPFLFVVLLAGMLKFPSTLEDELLSSREITSDMFVHFMDVGQSDATLIQCGNQAMLIDAGDGDKGTAIQNYLQKQGVEKLDYLILTHPDADHIGGAPVMITKFDIDTIFMSDFEKTNQTYVKLIQALDDKALRWSTPEVGSTYTLGGADFTILGPSQEYGDPNNSSISLVIQYGENTFLFSGDAEEEAEADILESGLPLQADVYHVGHHGSNTSSSEPFLDAIAPVYAVVSCGVDNAYGHPHAQTLNRLRERGVQLLRTDEQGSIIAVSNGSTISWNTPPTDTWQAGKR